MNPGELRHKITFQIQDLEQESEIWDEVCTVWANIKPIAGEEYYKAETIDSELTHRIIMRYRKGITPDMRVVYKGRIFYIQSVINDYERNVSLQLMCRELV